MAKQKGGKTEDKAPNVAAQMTYDAFVEENRKPKKRERPDAAEIRSIQAKPGDHAKFLGHALSMWDWQRPDVTDPAAVSARIQKYIQLCIDDDMKPSIEGLAVAFCTDRKTLWRWANGTWDGNKQIPQAARDMLKRAYTMVNLQMVDYMQNGKIHPVAGIFLMKNNFGYTDQTEIVVGTNNPLGDIAEQKRLEADYLIDVTPDEDEEK